MSDEESTTHEVPVSPWERFVDGWRAVASPGALMADGTTAGELDFVPFSDSLQLPRVFSLKVDEPGGEFSIILHFTADAGNIDLPQALCVGDISLPAALDKLRMVQPIDAWVQCAVGLLTAVYREIQGRLAKEYLQALGIDTTRHSKAALRRGVANLQARRAEVKTTGLRKPKRRNRITDEHLTEVAEVYRTADAQGMPPTQAVAEHFHTSHSTAARWVGLARRAGKELPHPRGAKERGEK